MYDEMKEKMAKLRKQEQAEMQDVIGKQREKDSEIEVLKEMIKGIKVQLKCNYYMINDKFQPRTLIFRG